MSSDGAQGQEAAAVVPSAEAPPEAAGEAECPICLESVWTDQVVLSCQHVFHRDCVSGTRNRKCPLCRTPFQPQDALRDEISQHEVPVEQRMDFILTDFTLRFIEVLENVLRELQEQMETRRAQMRDRVEQSDPRANVNTDTTVTERNRPDTDYTWNKKFQKRCKSFFANTTRTAVRLPNASHRNANNRNR
eukprot:GHVU01209291.1.p1 GENE.GHVU01209291.1~~GHVU01209291.1.p1  ORF type:complete len:198 (+),score=18.96 GHVU01209291.1:24-596(+)